MALINSMSLRGKLTLAGCALAFLAAAVIILKMATAPSYSTVMAGMDPTKSSQVTAALDAAGVKWKLAGGGTQVEVQQGQETAARVALAGKGLTSATQPDFSQTLDKQKLGASNMQQQIAYQRGLEGEIANTISQVQGAGGATVHLTLPQDDLFTSQAQPATAAVLLGGSSDAIDPAAVRGIANLVASSVPKLKPANVTITDAAGSMLWPNGASGGGGDAGGLATKPAAEARYDNQMEQQLNALLTQTLGAGKAQVQVHTDLDVDKTHLDTLTYAKKGVPLTKKVTSETLKGSGTTSGGTAGTASNLPTYAAASAGGSGTNNYTQKTTDTTNVLDKTVASTDKAQGTVNRMDIGLVIDTAAAAKLGDQGLKDLQSTLQSASGQQAAATKGSFSVTKMAFAKTATPKVAGPLIPTAFAGILKGVAVGIGALLFLLFITRHLRKREREELMDEPTWLRQLPRPEQPQMLQVPEGAPTVAMASLASADPRRQALEEIVRTEPDRVAAHLRSWITEDAQ
jgi:flagellar M-ring protein FliF